MIRGEAAALALFRTGHPLWSVRRVEFGDGYTAQKGGPPSLFGATLPELHDVITGHGRAPAGCVFCGGRGPLRDHGGTGDLVCADDDACLARGYRHQAATS
jgi:hypothetical protein